MNITNKFSRKQSYENFKAFAKKMKNNKDEFIKVNEIEIFDILFY
jgi:hypothetical protein